jgi:hypothetical protein
MRNAVLAAYLTLTSIHVAAGSELEEKVWNHGSAECGRTSA